MNPTLTFTQAMFRAASTRLKSITRRVATTGNQNLMTRLEHAINEDLQRADGLLTAELAVWQTVDCPYGSAGRTLPMVTNWRIASGFDEHLPTAITPAALHKTGIWWDDGSEVPEGFGVTRPARFFPKQLYSLAPQVEILSTQPEPLHAITEEDALREGIRPVRDEQGTITGYTWAGAESDPAENARAAFLDLWDSINLNRHDGKYAAAKDPIVWRVEFQLL